MMKVELARDDGAVAVRWLVRGGGSGGRRSSSSCIDHHFAFVEDQDTSLATIAVTSRFTSARLSITFHPRPMIWS